jgi:hypothetical protein
MSNYTISKIIFNGSIQTITSTITGSGPDADFDMNETDAASVEIGDIVTGQGVPSGTTVLDKQDTENVGLKFISVSNTMPASNVNPLTLTFTRPINSIYKNQTGIMVITPKAGYVVGHTDFSHGTLPTGISSVVFTTVGTAFTVGATVNATVTIASDFTVSADTVLTVPINGNARKLNASDVNNTVSQFSTPINANINFNNTNGISISNVTSTNSGVTVSTAGSGSNTVITVSGNVNTGEQVGSGDNGNTDDADGQQQQTPNYQEIFTFDVAADSAGIFDQNDIPGFEFQQTQFNDDDSSPFLFNPQSSTQNSNGETTGTTFSVSANVKENLSPADNITISATGKSKTARSTTPVIKNLKFGEGVISEFGETRKLEVFGDIGATFDLDVKDSSGTSILNVDDATIVKTSDLGIGESVYEKDVVIPAGTADKTYSVTITEKGSTIRGAGLGNFHDGFTTFSKTQANRPVFTLKFTRQSNNPLYDTPSSSILSAKFNSPIFLLGQKKAGVPIEDLRGVSLASTDVLLGNIVTVTRVLRTSNNSAFTFTSAKLNTADALTNHDSSKVSIINLSGALSTTTSSNDTFTLTFTLLFKSLDSDLTYDIQLAEFVLNPTS